MTPAGPPTPHAFVEWLAGLDPQSPGTTVTELIEHAKQALAAEAPPPPPPGQPPAPPGYPGAPGYPPPPAPYPQQPPPAPYPGGGYPPPPPAYPGQPQYPPPPYQQAPPPPPPGMPQAGPPPGYQPPLNNTTGGVFAQISANGLLPKDMTNEQIAQMRAQMPSLSPYFDPNGTVGEKSGIRQTFGSGLLPMWDALSSKDRIAHFNSLPRWAQEMLWSQMSFKQRRKFNMQRSNRPWTQF